MVKYKEESTVFVPSGEINSYIQYFGNLGKYKTKSVQFAPLNLSYRLTEKLSFQLEVYRMINAFNYNANDLNNENDNYFHGNLNIAYNHGYIGDTKIKWEDNLYLRGDNYFDSSENKAWFWYNPLFDFVDYFPKGDYINVTQFAFGPGLMYGANLDNSSGQNLKSAMIGLFSQYSLPYGFTFQLDVLGYKEWYKDSNFEVNGYDELWNLNIFAFLYYTKELHKFNEKISLTFNFQGGFDPLMATNKGASSYYPSMWSINNSNEMISPVRGTSDSWKSTYSLYATPQLELAYNHTKDLQFYIFVQAKLNNGVYGSNEKNYRIMPQGGIGVNYSF